MRGVKYNLNFKNNDGTTTILNEIKMSDLLNKLENLLKENYDINDRISNQTIYNLQHRPSHASKLMRLFVRVEKAT